MSIVIDIKYNICYKNLGVKNSNWDKKDGYSNKRDCYNSYLYKVEDEEISHIDKIILHGKSTSKYLDGGSALHLNLEEAPNQEGFIKLIHATAKAGCNYFCFNIKITVCRDCNHIDKKTKHHCKKCDSGNVDHATRVIGYLKKVASFSSDRQKEHTLRHYHIEKTN